MKKVAITNLVTVAAALVDFLPTVFFYITGTGLPNNEAISRVAIATYVYLLYP